MIRNECSVSSHLDWCSIQLLGMDSNNAMEILNALEEVNVLQIEHRFQSKPRTSYPSLRLIDDGYDDGSNNVPDLFLSPSVSLIGDEDDDESHNVLDHFLSCKCKIPFHNVEKRTPGKHVLAKPE